MSLSVNHQTPRCQRNIQKLSVLNVMFMRVTRSHSPQTCRSFSGPCVEVWWLLLSCGVLQSKSQWNASLSQGALLKARCLFVPWSRALIGFVPWAPSSTPGKRPRSPADISFARGYFPPSIRIVGNFVYVLSPPSFFNCFWLIVCKVGFGELVCVVTVRGRRP